MHLLRKFATWLFQHEADRIAPPGVPSPPQHPAAEREEHARIVREAAEHMAAGRLAEAEHVLALALERRHDDVETLLLQGLVQKQRGSLEDAADSFRLATHFRPEFAEAHYQLGLVEASQVGSGDAEQCFRKAITGDPHHAPAHNALGGILVRHEFLEEAVDCFQKAVELDPDYASAHSNLGFLMLARLDRFAEGAAHLEKAWRMAPDAPDVMCNWAMYLLHCGRLAESIALCDRLLQLDATSGAARLNRGLALLKLGDFSRGWIDYEARKQSAWQYVARHFPFPEWKGEPLAGRRVLVHAEQGIGDQIMFASCLPDIARLAAQCVVECDPKLKTLFRRSFPELAVIDSGSADNGGSQSPPGADLWIAMGSLPLHFRRSIEEFPLNSGYLKADPDRIEAWRRRLAKSPGLRKVGISWRGGMKSTRQSIRTVPLEEWLPIVRRADVDFVSLQYGDHSEEIRCLKRHHGIMIHHWQDAIDDYDETAALVCALDVVISVPTSIVHLGGAIGRTPVWVMVPAVAGWRYMDSGERLPWYPTVRLFRQEPLGEWESVIERVATVLDRSAVEHESSRDADR